MNEISSNKEGMSVSSANGAAEIPPASGLPSPITAPHANIKQGSKFRGKFPLSCNMCNHVYHLFCLSVMSNGGFLEDGFVPSDRRPGRRSRRHKSSTKSQDGKNQVVASEKDTNNTRPQDSLHTAVGKIFVFGLFFMPFILLFNICNLIRNFQLLTKDVGGA